MNNKLKLLFWYDSSKLKNIFKKHELQYNEFSNGIEFNFPSEDFYKLGVSNVFDLILFLNKFDLNVCVPKIFKETRVLYTDDKLFQQR